MPALLKRHTSHKKAELQRTIDGPISPFLKWAGGKRWIAGLVAAILNSQSRYVEPFLGSAACFFSTNCQSAVLADNNDELMNCFRVVRDNPRGLITRLSSLTIDRRTFRQIRATTERSNLNRAVRFLYLNRTAFNGIYRVNRLGQFNVPFGCKPTTVVCDNNAIVQCSQRLRRVDLLTCDFRAVLGTILRSDSLYIDPPYTVKHNNNAFRRYNECIFSWDDQVSLAASTNRLAARSVPIVITNAFHQDVMALYSASGFYAFMVSRHSNMAANSTKRGPCEELLLVSRAAVPSLRFLKSLIESHTYSRAISIRLRRE
jgi:DNA adenine methylase